MDRITIKQAGEKDIPVLEEIYLDVIGWLDSIGKPLWTKERVSREGLLREFSPEEFYIAHMDGMPVACMALQDFAPFFWFEPLEKGESLFLRRLAVKRCAAGKNLSKVLLEHAVGKCRERNIATLRLDCDANIEKLNKLYEDFGFRLERRETMNLGGRDYHISFYGYHINGGKEHG